MMFLLQAKTEPNLVLFFFRLVGLLIAVGIFSIISGLFIKLSVKIVSKTSVRFSRSFWISFFTILITFIINKGLELFIIAFLMCAALSVEAQESEAQKLVRQGLEKDFSGNYAEAIEFYKRALVLVPNDVSIYTNLGAAYIELKQYDEAIATLEKAIALDPNFAKAFYNLGVVYSLTNRNAEAVSVLQKAIAINPQYAKARTQLCVEYLEVKQNKEAVSCYKELLPLVPQNVTARSNYGFALMKINRLKEAIAILEETAALFPSHMETYNNLGCALFKSGRRKEAISAFQKGLAIVPDNENLRYNLALVQIADKNKSAALEQYAFLKNSNAELAQRLYEIIYRGKIVMAKQK